MSERQMFINEPIKSDEAKETIKEELKRHRFFPPITDSWDNEKFYLDGLVIEECGGTYILHEQMSGATMNLLFTKEDTFIIVDEAIEKYLRAGNLTIDGVEIVD